jgi:hypothetical protein
LKRGGKLFHKIKANDPDRPDSTWTIHKSIFFFFPLAWESLPGHDLIWKELLHPTEIQLSHKYTLHPDIWEDKRFPPPVQL